MADRLKPLFQILLIVVITVLSLLPFLDKAFHMNDPLFIWSASHILDFPYDFYGFVVNWDVTLAPMSRVMKSPPLASYFVALASISGGMSERSLHAFFMLPAVMVSVGTYFLARKFTDRAVLAALVVVFTPLFLVSATGVTGEVLMLAFFIWAVYFWIRGVESGKRFTILVAGFLIACSSLSGYFGLFLIPLLTVYSILFKHRVRRLALGMIVPVLILFVYEWVTDGLYGSGLLLNAMEHASSVRHGFGAELARRTLLLTVFTGGAVISVLFFTPLLFGYRSLLFFLALIVLGVLALVTFGSMVGVSIGGGGSFRYLILIHMAVFVTTGLTIVWLVILELSKREDKNSILFFLWIMGVFGINCLFGWNLSAAALLPILPAVAILVTRKVASRVRLCEDGKPPLLWWPLIPALVISLMVAWADYTFAGSARTAARTIYEKHSKEGATVWFYGHRGFHFYMSFLGAKAVDRMSSRIKRGDIIVVPRSGASVVLNMADDRELIEEFSVDRLSWLSIMNARGKVGFYPTDSGALLPYLFGPTGGEKYSVYRAKKSIRPK
ncbi:MAG: glycosyltransferase family 39 protein [Thermodesulfobacteriota bacterium]